MTKKRDTTSAKAALTGKKGQSTKRAAVSGKVIVRARQAAPSDLPDETLSNASGNTPSEASNGAAGSALGSSAGSELIKTPSEAPANVSGEASGEALGEVPSKTPGKDKAASKAEVSEKAAAPDILFISGSPRAHTCESLAGIIEGGARAAGARSQHFFLSKKHIAPCIGCNACTKTGVCILASRTSGDKLIDDYLELKALLERTDALALIAPLYFAGPPAQLKALLDRMQPYWAKRYVLGQEAPPKRPAQLFIVGAGDAYGHDPHGHDPLVGIVKSTLAVAGFSLEKVHNFVGLRSGKEKPVLPPDDAPAGRSLGERAQLKRAVAVQADFEQRAYDAGGALARFVLWSRTAKLGVQTEPAKPETAEAKILEAKAPEPETAESEAAKPEAAEPVAPEPVAPEPAAAEPPAPETTTK